MRPGDTNGPAAPGAQGSIGFDRAAGYYDATRALPGDIGAAITEAIMKEAESADAQRLLEVGIGTGRMARPLMQRGLQVVGVDISAPMMERLVGQLTAGHTRPDLLLGDATALPFRDGAFPAVLAVHVLHLVASAADALAEIRRVLSPGGVFLQQIRRPDELTQQKWDDHEAFWQSAAAAAGVRLRLRPDHREIDTMLAASGARVRETELGQGVAESSVEEELEHLRWREYSWMWLVPDKVIEANLPAYAEWLRRWSSGDGLVDRFSYVLQAASWPGG